jgi:hypothetical protein
MRTGLHPQFPANREQYREFYDLGASSTNSIARSRCAAAVSFKIPYVILTENIFARNRDCKIQNREFGLNDRKRPLLTRLFLRGSNAICSHQQIFRWRTRCRQFASGTARLFGGRTTRLGFKVSSISVSIARLTGFQSRRFGWRAKFKAEPQTPARKVLYRRGRLSHTLSPGLMGLVMTCR